MTQGWQSVGLALIGQAGNESTLYLVLFIHCF
jgi:hypothetical protein